MTVGRVCSLLRLTSPHGYGFLRADGSKRQALPLLFQRGASKVQPVDAKLASAPASPALVGLSTPAAIRLSSLLCAAAECMQRASGRCYSVQYGYFMRRATLFHAGGKRCGGVSVDWEGGY